MRNCLLIISVFLCGGYFSQSLLPIVVAASGDFGTGATASLSWTLGEIVTETAAGGGNFLTQGFQQPFLSTTAFIDHSNSHSPVRVFPNPAGGLLFFILPGEDQVAVVSVKDVNGREIMREQISTSFEAGKIDTGQLAPGIYFLQLTGADGKSTQIFKVVKQ